MDRVEVDKIVLPGRFSDRISELCEVIEVTETSSQDWNLQRTVKQILDDTIHEPSSRTSERISEQSEVFCFYFTFS